MPASRWFHRRRLPASHTKISSRQPGHIGTFSALEVRTQTSREHEELLVPFDDNAVRNGTDKNRECEAPSVLRPGTHRHTNKSFSKGEKTRGPMCMARRDGSKVFFRQRRQTDKSLSSVAPSTLISLTDTSERRDRE